MKFILFFITCGLLANQTLLYELKEINVKNYEQVLYPYFYDISNKEKEVDKLGEIFKFLALRNDKLYGKSKLLINPESEKKLISKRIIQVELNSIDENNFKKMLAEIIYTFNAQNIHGVEFINNKKYKNKIFTRKDVNFTSFTTIVEMYKVLPPNKIMYSFIKLPDDEIINSETFYSKLENNNKKITKFILKYIKVGNKEQKINSLRALSYIKKLKSKDIYLAPVLKEKDEELLLAALDGLAGTRNKYSLREIELLMNKSKNNKIKLNCSKILIMSNKNKFLKKGLAYFLKSNDIKNKLEIIASVKQHENLKVIELMLDDSNKDIKLAVLHNLKAYDKKSFFDRLKKLLNDTNKEIALIAADILSTNKSYKVFAHYHYLKLNNKNSIISAKKLQKYKSKDTLNNLINCMKSNNKKLAYECANTLLILKEKDSIIPFFKLVQRSKKSMPEGMDINFISLLSSKELIAYLNKEKIDSMSIALLKGIAKNYKDKKADNIASKIENYLKSKNDNLRLQAMITLGEIKGKKALDIAKIYKEDKNNKVKEQIIKNLYFYDKDNVSDVFMFYLNDKDDKIRLQAIDGIIKFKIEEALPSLKQYINSSIKTVKTKSLEAFVKISRKISTEMEGIFQDFLDQDDKTIRKWAIYGLVKTGKKTNLPFMIIYSKDSSAEVRKAVLYAVGELNNPQKSQIDFLISFLDDENAKVRKEAVESISKIGKIADIDKIKKVISSVKDKEIQNLLKDSITTIKDRNTIE